MQYDHIINNYNFIKENISLATKEYDRKESEINLLAVTKNRTIEEIQVLIDQGHKYFGENKVQEAKEKWLNLKEKNPDIKLHLIGHLQSNKLAEAVDIFDVIETVDSYKISEMIKNQIIKTGKNIEILIQINIGEEEQKYGILPKDAEIFIDRIKNEFKLDIKGLMCIPPHDDQQAFLYFSLLKKIATNHHINYLSMGMSEDFKIAIACGSNEIRIGRAIFEPNLTLK